MTEREALRLRAENHNLRVALAQAQAQVAEWQLKAQQAALEQDIRTAFKLPADAPIDWSTLLQPPEKAE
jgi:hypothetical protein